jgi:hypothetical protein
VVYHKPPGKGKVLPEFTEDFPMTFQLGIVSSDRVLLASDRLCIRLQNGVRLPEHKNKISDVPDKKLAYCWSGSDLMGAVAEDVSANIEGETGELLKLLMIQSADRVLTEERRKADNRNYGISHVGRVLFVFYGVSPIQLWTLGIDTPRRGVADVQQIQEKTVINGDSVNPATHYCPAIS